MPKTFWDLIAYSGIWLAAIFEGIWFYSEAVPNVSLHVDPLFTEPLWALLPLALLLLSAGITLYRVLTGHIPLQIEVPPAAERRPLPQIKWAGLIPTALVAAMLGGGATYLGTVVWAPHKSLLPRQSRITAVAPAIPRAAYAPVLRGAITLDYVEAVLRAYRQETAAAILAKYLGKPIIASGFIKMSESQEGNTIYIYYLTEKTTPPVIYMVFSSDKNTGLPYLNNGDFIQGVCHIERLDSTGIGLDGCVLMKDGAATGGS